MRTSPSGGWFGNKIDEPSAARTRDHRVDLSEAAESVDKAGIERVLWAISGVGRSFESSWPSSHFNAHECLREPGSYHVSVRVYLSVHKGCATHNLSRASPKAQVGSKPSRTQPLPTTSYLSRMLGTSLRRRRLCGSDQNFVELTCPLLHVPPGLVLTENLGLPRSFTVSIDAEDVVAVGAGRNDRASRGVGLFLTSKPFAEESSNRLTLGRPRRSVRGIDIAPKLWVYTDTKVKGRNSASRRRKL